MTRSFVPRSPALSRTAALSVAITLFATPLASAQSPEAAPPSVPSANTALLSPAAFARLIHPPPMNLAPAPVVADAPRPSLLRQGTAATGRQAQTTPVSPAQQKSWASRHKTALVWTTIAAVAGVGFAVWWLTCHNCE